MPPFTFGQERRLRRHAEFVQAQRTGRRVATPHFTLLVARQPDAKAEGTTARMGLVVSGKVGSAVKRNRVKRMCRECFRTWPNLLPAGVDLVVIARPGAHELSSGQVRAEWLAVRESLHQRANEALGLGGAAQNRGPRRNSRAGDENKGP
jgi:ribonuclease P protein component